LFSCHPPRLYFLSNEELLDILAQAKNPAAVQPHINKCFEGVRALDFASGASPEAAAPPQAPAAALGPGAGAATAAVHGVRPAPEVVGLLSPEGERLAFGKAVKVGVALHFLSLVRRRCMLTLPFLLPCCSPYSMMLSGSTGP
jgi:hypothetical protein